MTMTPPPVPGEKRSSCAPYAIGCGVVVLIAVLILVGVVVWLFLPGGDRIEMKAMVGTNAVAMVHLTDCAEDPGMIALSENLSRIVREAQRADLARQLPEKLRGLSDLGALSQGNWKPSYLPEVVLAAEDLTPSNQVLVVGAALDGLPKIFTLPFRIGIEKGGSSGSVTRYRGQGILDTTDGRVMFFGTTVLFASDLPAMQGAIDRVLDGSPPAPLFELVPPSYPERWDLYAIVQNRDDILAGLVRELEDGGGKIVLSIATELIEEAWLGIDVVSAEQVRAELVMNCVDHASANGIMGLVRGSLEEALAEIDDPMVDIVIHGESAERQATITVDVVGVSRLIEKQMSAAMGPPSP